MILGMWWIASVIVGAWIAHGFFNGAAALVEITTYKSINAPTDLLARWIRPVRFEEFHRGSILCVAGLFAWRLWRHIPEWHTALRRELAALREDSTAIRLALLSFFLCLLFTTAITLASGDRLLWRRDQDWAIPLLGAWGAAAFLELAFRGVCWRACLECMPPPITGLVVALCFVGTMLTLAPPGIHSWQPALSSERFPLSSAIMAGLIHGPVWLEHVFPLLLLAASLWVTRLHRPSLWLAIGTQAGFLFSSSGSATPHPPALAAMLSTYVLCGSPFSLSPRTS